MRVLVTGCSSGFGRAAAERLAARGHEVVATARRPEALADLAGVETLALDVTDDASVAAARDAAGPVDALVNNAGVHARGPLERIPVEEARRLLETNVLGVLRTVRAFVPGMRERGRGRVVNVSSIAGRVAYPLAGAYAASKFALEGLSETLHFELSRFGVRVVILQPGFFETPLADKTPSHGEDDPPYDELRRQWQGADAKLGGGGPRPGPGAVAEAICEAVESPDPPLRWPVGSDAEMVLSARSRLDDTRFESAMRQLLGLDW